MIEKSSLIKRVSKAFLSPFRPLNTGQYYDKHIEGCMDQADKSVQNVTAETKNWLDTNSKASLAENPEGIVQSINDNVAYNLYHYAQVPGLNGAGPNGPPM